MVSLAALTTFVREILTEWRGIHVADLQFWQRDTARLMLIVLAGLALVLILVRSMIARRPGRDRVALPAVLPWARRSGVSWIRHAPVLLVFVGLPFFALALADPYTSLQREEVTFPGRRIALMVDASSSMMTPFKGSQLNAKGPIQVSFFTTVATAEYFIRLRMQGKYRDLVALIEFGNEAYVITPFTSDYENILLSTSLIGDFTEWSHFPDTGTVIARAIDQSVDLFRAFDFLNASGNLMVIISDGQDTQASANGRKLSEILSSAVDTKIPVYFIRIAYNLKVGHGVADELWKEAVEQTGGKFYAGASEETIMQAVQEINKVSVGKISTRQYSTQRPQFSGFALIAASMWSFALLLKLTVPWFRKFP